MPSQDMSQTAQTEVVSLSGAWRFAIDPQGSGGVQGWMDACLDDRHWETITVPHTWNVMPDHVGYHGIAWYRRSFAVLPSIQGKLVRLHFEAVFYRARVWLNGVLLGTHEGGYTPFEFDVSAPLLFGAQNVLAVEVDNEARTDRIPTPPLGWHNDGGILRDVSLQITNPAYVRHHRIVAVPYLTGPNEAGGATIATTAWVRNTGAETLHGTLRADVIDDASGQSVLGRALRTEVALAPGQETAVEWTASVASPKLWHFDHPHLYRWSTALYDADGKALHTAEAVFGIRTVEFQDGYLALNAEPMRLVGLTRHQTSPEYGAAEPVEMMKADYDDLKNLNMVLSRPVHYPQHPYILDYCDRKGILLIPEVPAWQLRPDQMADEGMRELERQQLCEMIESEWNHPSIWAWSVCNEIASNTPEGRAFVDEMVAYCHELDPTRPVSFASDKLGRGAWTDAAGDFIMMNQYYGMWHGPKAALGPVLETAHASWPEKGLLISEWGFSSQWRFPDSPPRDPSRYYDAQEGMPPDAPEVDAVRCQQIADQMPVFRSKPFVAGCIYWTYQDYGVRGEAFVMGVVDVDRNRRPSWTALRDEYAPLRFESVAFPSSSGSRRKATVTLRTRGPIERDLPVYTLRGYHLSWAVLSQDGHGTLAEGTLPLPVLAPGSEWSCEIEWNAPQSEGMLKLCVVRPTGFMVIDRTYHTTG